MKTNNIIKTIVKEKTSDYSNDQETQNHISIWVLTTNGKMLVKKLTDHSSKIEENDLTVHGSSLKEAIHNMERQTGILCHSDLYRKVYSKFLKDKHLRDETYFLCVNLDKEHEEIVEDIFDGKFIDYREVMNYLMKFNLTQNCKDRVLSFIATLYEKYSFL